MLLSFQTIPRKNKKAGVRITNLNLSADNRELQFFMNHLLLLQDFSVYEFHEAERREPPKVVISSVAEKSSKETPHFFFFLCSVGRTWVGQKIGESML